jgi:AAA15 family ATPase/GTPase
MRIKSIRLEKFKRFTDLCIDGIPSSAKLVVLVGPNGCGKSSIFDAFKTWHLIRGYNNGADDDYCKKDQSEKRRPWDLVNIVFHEDISRLSNTDLHDSFYFRTAYRNSPQVNVSELKRLTSPLEVVDHKMMIQNDSTIDDNYQRLISRTISKVYNIEYDNSTVKAIREEIIAKIKNPFHRLFPDLTFSEIGMITEKPEFYFSKGSTNKYSYEKLSGGEKATFDLLLDFVIKSEYYKNTVFCIDEPESHIHTQLQASLLYELYQLIPNCSQLWIATHSFGMLKEARKLYTEHPEEVVFLDFDGYDFDDSVKIVPSNCDTTLWNKMLEITLDDYAPFLTPETIIFCEGTSKGRKRSDFDAKCLANIFSSEYPSVMSYPLGGCNEIEERNQIVKFVSTLSPRSKIIKLVDRDDRSPEEIDDLKARGINVLKRRHLESYLLDNSVIEKWCLVNNKNDEASAALSIKQECMQASIGRGNPPDDIKSASNDICTKVKNFLQITCCGNSGEMILRDTLSKLITSEMAIYQELKREIFQ